MNEDDARALTPVVNKPASRKPKPAQHQSTAEEIGRDRERFRECGYDHEAYEAIYGAPGEFPAMEY